MTQPIVIVGEPQQLVARAPVANIVDRHTTHSLTAHVDERVLIANEHREVVIERRRSRELLTKGQLGPRGLQGPTGAPGVGGIPSFQLPAGEQIFSGRAVVAVNGELFLADPTGAPEDIAGISLNAATIGDLVTVQTDGPLSDISWSWAPGTIWCGIAGVLTQVLPTVAGGYAWLSEVATAVSPTELVMNRSLFVEI